MTVKDIKRICQIYDNLRRERDAATIAYNSEDTFWEHVLATYNLSQSFLPSNLDEAAEKYAKENYVDEEDGTTYIEEALRNTFKAGAEWSEEDEKMVRFYEADYNNQIGDMPMIDVINMRLKFKNWLANRLKSLHPQPHTVSVENATKFGNLEYERGVKDGIQSEKSRHWKPNKEQMGSLNYAYCELFKREDVGHNILGPLQNLIDTLSKL